VSQLVSWLLRRITVDTTVDQLMQDSTNIHIRRVDQGRHQTSLVLRGCPELNLAIAIALALSLSLALALAMNV